MEFIKLAFSLKSIFVIYRPTTVPEMLHLYTLHMYKLEGLPCNKEFFYIRPLWQSVVLVVSILVQYIQ